MFTSLINFLTAKTPLLYLTQSIWRDEGFSYFMAKPNIFGVIINSAHDFNPPLYYLILHFWMKLVGESDIALRMMSLIFFLLTVFSPNIIHPILYTVTYQCGMFHEFYVQTNKKQPPMEATALLKSFTYDMEAEFIRSKIIERV